ncbi:hypothetical protein B0H10DRAFT_2097054 [Mycena sp. CBHHK59/15]|nr:hypothetical protein B0H10DRAFT_2097054 [Mycena sp. CBHHK59/15]
MGSYCGWYSWASLSLTVALLFCTSALHQDRMSHRPSLTLIPVVLQRHQTSATFPTFPIHQTNTPVISPCIFPSHCIHQPSRRITQDATNSQVTQSALLSSQVYEHEHAPLPPLASPCSPPPHRAAPSPAALRAHSRPAAAVSTPTPHGAHQLVHAATVLAQPVLPTTTPVRTRAAAQCRLGVL